MPSNRHLLMIGRRSWYLKLSRIKRRFNQQVSEHLLWKESDRLCHFHRRGEIYVGSNRRWTESSENWSGSSWTVEIYVCLHGMYRLEGDNLLLRWCFWTPLWLARAGSLFQVRWRTLQVITAWGNAGKGMARGFSRSNVPGKIVSNLDMEFMNSFNNLQKSESIWILVLLGINEMDFPEGSKWRLQGEIRVPLEPFIVCFGQPVKYVSSQEKEVMWWRG